MRLACVHIPHLALQAVLRRRPELRGTPIALTETSGGARKTGTGKPGPAKPGSGRTLVVTASAEARRAGVRIGLTAAQAAAACPGLTLFPATDADRDAAEAALADLGYAFAPRIERERSRIFFEIGDLGRLYPSEAAAAQAIQARGTHLGLGVRVAVAATKGVARVATRARELVVVAGSAEAAFLGPLPLAVLDEPLDPALVDTFRRWGLGTVGALARLPAADVALRLGGAGARLHRLARGLCDEPFLPALPADAVEEGCTLDDAITELEPLSFVLRGLFDRLLTRLGCRSLACAAITLRLQLETRAFDVRTINLAAPTRELGPLLQLARLELTRRPPDAPITSVLVVAHPARARAAQLDFLRPAGPAPDRLAATLARLGALCGVENVGAPVLEDTWREEAVGMTTFALSPPANDGGTRRGSAGTSVGANDNAGARPLTIRRYRPPEEIEVMLGPAGPSALRGKETTARILVAAGPYRLSGEWWRLGDPQNDNDSRAGGDDNVGQLGAGFSRDYWDVHASDGALYRLHHDRARDRWYLDGYYD